VHGFFLCHKDIKPQRKSLILKNRHEKAQKAQNYRHGSTQLCLSMHSSARYFSLSELTQNTLALTANPEKTGLFF
jgi:uncharacterized protein YqiB (DUF1249 family)